MKKITVLPALLSFLFISCNHTPPAPVTEIYIKASYLSAGAWSCPGQTAYLEKIPGDYISYTECPLGGTGYGPNSITEEEFNRSVYFDEYIDYMTSLAGRAFYEIPVDSVYIPELWPQNNITNCYETGLDCSGYLGNYTVCKDARGLVVYVSVSISPCGLMDADSTRVLNSYEESIEPF